VIKILLQQKLYILFSYNFVTKYRVVVVSKSEKSDIEASL